MRHDIDLQQHGPLAPAMADAISTCVHCGFCLPACPTYQELGRETDSPRGRIILMKEVLEGNLPLESAAPHIDGCLGCLACVPACPSEVAYGDLISPFRAVQESKRKRTWQQRIQRRITRWTLPYPRRFRLAALSGRLAKPIAHWMPATLSAMLGLLPDHLPKRVKLNEFYPASGERRGRVALLAGCAQTVLDPDINLATIDVLVRNGIEVLVPRGQVCCGALSWHVGDQRSAQGFANQNLDAFPKDVDAIITNAAGCGSGMHEYPLVMQGTARVEEAREFAAGVVDVSVYLDALGKLRSIPQTTRPVRVAYHDACHLAHAQAVRQPPRRLLEQIPGLEMLEIHEGDMCCGSAGTYNLDQPDMANSLGERKARNILDTEADIVAMGNIGCLTQTATHLARLNSTIKARHTVQILRDAYEQKLS